MKRFMIAMLLTFSSLNLFAGVDTGTDDNDVVLAGHDTVAYHTEGKPVLGKPDITAVYNGAIYRFSSTKNRNNFVANPAKYAPAYGGYCALGTSLGKKFQVDGKAFEVVDGQLYVNKNLKVYKSWKKDIPGNLKKSEANWPKIRDIAANEL
ncbi:MAG: YHS domain-containing (seleno)protein [Pseudomonadales bacterium]